LSMTKDVFPLGTVRIDAGRTGRDRRRWPRSGPPRVAGHFAAQHLPAHRNGRLLPRHGALGDLDARRAGPRNRRTRPRPRARSGARRRCGSPARPQAAAAAARAVLDGSAPMSTADGADSGVRCGGDCRTRLATRRAEARAGARAEILASTTARFGVPAHPRRGLLQRHARHRTAHAALVPRSVAMLAARSKRGRPPGRRRREAAQRQRDQRAALTLPTTCPCRRSAGERYVPLNNRQDQMRHDSKLGTHRPGRGQAHTEAAPDHPPHSACLARPPAQGLSEFSSPGAQHPVQRERIACLAVLARGLGQRGSPRRQWLALAGSPGQMLLGPWRDGACPARRAGSCST